MNITTRIASVAVTLLASSLALACEYPERPHLPDGATASKDELIAAKGDVQGFIAAVDDYLRCIEEEDAAAIAEMGELTDEEKQRRNELMNQKFDAANDEKALVGEQFNQQIRAFNAKIKKAKD